MLTGLGAAHDRIAAAMYALDVHPGLEVLRGVGLTGETASRWRVLRPETDVLWAQFALLGDLLEQARAIRARPRLDDAAQAELSRLLREPVVSLGPDDLPAENDAAARWVSIGELTQRLEQRCTGVLTHLSEVDAARKAVASALVRTFEAVDAAALLAAQLGETRVADELRAAQAEAERLDLADPIAAAPDGRLSEGCRARLDRLRDRATDARRALDEVVRVRDGYPDRRASLVASLSDVATAEQDVARANRRAAEKIADPALEPAPATADTLRSRLTALDQLAQRGEWSKLVAQLSTVEESVRRARDRARELAGLADGLVARRDELRGRLEAYRAKAAARGFAEHQRLATHYTDAHALLYTAPCDLRAATRAVHAYQQALVDVLGIPERSDVDG